MNQSQWIALADRFESSLYKTADGRMVDHFDWFDPSGGFADHSWRDQYFGRLVVAVGLDEEVEHVSGFISVTTDSGLVVSEVVIFTGSRVVIGSMRFAEQHADISVEIRGRSIESVGVDHVSALTDGDKWPWETRVTVTLSDGTGFALPVRSEGTSRRDASLGKFVAKLITKPA